MVAQPGVEVFWPIEIEQGVGQGFEVAQGKGLDACLLGRAEAAAEALKQAEGESGGFGLAAFLLALLLTLQVAQPEDLAVSHAAREVFDGDPTHGADLWDGAAAKA